MLLAPVINRNERRSAIMLSIQEIGQLIEKLDQSSIDEFSYEANGTKIELKKNNPSIPDQTTKQAFTPKEQPAQPGREIPAEKEKVQKEENPPEETMQEDYDHEIISPMVGTFYSSPSPDQPAYVQVGDKVNSDSIVCIVEAMKLFNEIEADVDGVITEILVENGELVEYGQPLFRIKQG